MKRYVTASLHVDYLRPTPMGKELEIISTAQTGNVRKVVVTVQIFAEGKLRARGEVIAAPIPQAMLPPGHLKD